ALRGRYIARSVRRHPTPSWRHLQRPTLPARASGTEGSMAENSARDSRSPAAATVAEVMEPALTTAELNDHVAAAAYLMKHAGATALVVLDTQTGRPIGILTDTDVAHVVADGKNVNDVRLGDVMTP